MKTIVWAYILLSAIYFLIGGLDANKGGVMWDYAGCLRRPNKIQPFIPAYKIACYLFSTRDPWFFEEALRDSQIRDGSFARGQWMFNCLIKTNELYNPRNSIPSPCWDKYWEKEKKKK